jgi:hypothetical protein
VAQIRRSTKAWQPLKLLCKRFNCPVPQRDDAYAPEKRQTQVSCLANGIRQLAAVLTALAAACDAQELLTFHHDALAAPTTAHPSNHSSKAGKVAAPLGSIAQGNNRKTTGVEAEAEDPMANADMQRPTDAIFKAIFSAEQSSSSSSASEDESPSREEPRTAASASAVQRSAQPRSGSDAAAVAGRGRNPGQSTNHESGGPPGYDDSPGRRDSHSRQQG